MSSGSEVIYSEAGPFERALAKAFTDRLPIPIRDLLDPALTPEAFLAFLGSSESADLWFGDWPLVRKREMVQAARDGLAALKGTRDGPDAFIRFVGGAILDRISYPTRFVLGRARVGRTPIGHPPFAARYLVKVATTRPPRALVLGRGMLGRATLRTPTREPLRRCLVALAASKGEATEYRVDFSHRRTLRLDDAPSLDGGFRLGQFVDRVRL
ncbi:phage tail protein I [Aureimonas sp. AU40]|uniref:phage tail protein I n=1 Tax=Aureimonas sp. AU40 TaxID=1637747 RepID=UPI000782C551|nr:phage tail protein I [Aureimonas sp. AU40]